MLSTAVIFRINVELTDAPTIPSQHYFNEQAPKIITYVAYLVVISTVVFPIGFSPKWLITGF